MLVKVPLAETATVTESWTTLPSSGDANLTVAEPLGAVELSAVVVVEEPSPVVVVVVQPPVVVVVVVEPALATRLKLAVTVTDAFPAKVQEPVPEQIPPLQPSNTEPTAGVAVSVTEVPAGKLAEQAVPQSMPAGVLTTDPAPVPVRLTVTLYASDAGVAHASFEYGETLWASHASAR